MTDDLEVRDMVFAYSDKLYADIGQHVFPIRKYRMIYERLIKKEGFSPEIFVEPEMATVDDLLLVHTQEYVHDFMSLLWTDRTRYSELPLDEDIRNSYLVGTGGTILSCRRAISDGISVNIGGGFHHAFPDHAEGFCYTNDIAIAIRRMQKEKLANKVIVIDCDVHQGNGTAFIFRNDKSVFTFSIHQEYNYPIKQKSDLDIGLNDWTDDYTYMSHLRRTIPNILDNFKPDLAIYLAGADPYKDDKLGGLSLTIAGLLERDKYVISQCMDRDVPIAILLAGGYAYNTEDTVTIHVNTCKTAFEFSLRSQ